MLLRRITEHVKAQNWTAVFIDLVIVVVGVFIGIQVANWNEVRNNQSGLIASLERLDKEVTHNIGLIDDVLVRYVEGRADLDLGRESLSTCDDSPEGEAALERLLFDLTNDVQPNFASVSLDQLASQVRYQDLLSADFQQQFGLYAARLKEEHEQLTSHYGNLWAHHVNFHPAVTAHFGDDSYDYAGWGFSLAKPYDEVCRDATFRNRFINTIGFYTSINDRLQEFKDEALTFQSALADELARL